MNTTITWVPAQSISEEQTRQIAREFCSSRPAPRNRAMGFNGKDPKRQRRRGNQCAACGARIVDPWTMKVEHDAIACAKKVGECFS